MTLKDYRDALSLTQQQLDELAGLTLGTVAQIENGRNTNPSWFVVKQLMKALHEKGLTGLIAEDVFPEPVRSR